MSRSRERDFLRALQEFDNDEFVRFPVEIEGKLWDFMVLVALHSGVWEEHQETVRQDYFEMHGVHQERVSYDDELKREMIETMMPKILVDAMRAGVAKWLHGRIEDLLGDDYFGYWETGHDTATAMAKNVFVADYDHSDLTRHKRNIIDDE